MISNILTCLVMISFLIYLTIDLSFMLVVPHLTTVLLEPQPEPCQQRGDKLRMLIAVFSAPSHALARSVVRKTWAKIIRDVPGVELVFFLGRDQDNRVEVS